MNAQKNELELSPPRPPPPTLEPLLHPAHTHTRQLGRHENLVAVCLLTIALLCLGVMLYVLRPILIPFAVSLLFYYLLQPIVNALSMVGPCLRA